MTTRHLAATGVGPGWRCWEVGAGGPTVSAWLARRVGPTGSVLATDIDLSRFGASPPGVSVRVHDVVADPRPTAPSISSTPDWSWCTCPPVPRW